MSEQLLVKAKYILPMDKDLSVLKDAAVLIEGNAVIELGRSSEMEKDYKGKIIDAKNSIILPGLINTHTHAAMTYFRGLADDLPLDIWLKKYIWPAEAKYVEPGFVKNASELGILEMLRSGITCFNDMYFFQNISVQAALGAGIRMMAGECILDFPSPSFKDPESALAATKELLEEYQDNELIKVLVSPHSVYACSKKTLELSGRLADAYNTGIHMHVSETKKEVENARKDFNKTPLAFLDSLGLLSERFIAVHSVWVDNDDLDLLQKRRVKVSHNPVSNMKLASGILPIKEMFYDRGITMGLATDGASSNNVLDLFSDMRACSLLHKVNNNDPAIMKAREVVKMATIDAAEVLGVSDKLGSLEPGKRADLISIGLDRAHLVPIYDPYSHIVYCANRRDVDNVIINGRIIVAGAEVKTMDEEAIIKQANKFSV